MSAVGRFKRPIAIVLALAATHAAAGVGAPQASVPYEMHPGWPAD